jgi:cysteine desulfurase
VNRIYLDNHTTTRPSTAAVAAMAPFLAENWGLPTAPHRMGEELLAPMERAYRAIYSLLGASEHDGFIFTSSGTEAINHVVWATYFDRVRESGRNHFLTAATDAAPIVLALERLEQLGCEMALIPVDSQGQVTAEALAEALTPRTVLFSLSWANALTGTLQPVVALAEVCRERGVLFHLDASAVLGRISFNLDEIAPDLISFNGDHLHAPKGTGGLWIRSGLRLSPLMLGGMEQDGQRGGPFSVALLVALGVAAQEAVSGGDRLSTETARLRDRLERQVLQRVAGAVALFGEAPRLPTTTALAFPGANADALLYLLNRRGLLASFGGGTYQQLALQLEAAGVARPLADCAISLSLSRETMQEEVDRAANLIAEAVEELRASSKGLWD